MTLRQAEPTARRTELQQARTAVRQFFAGYVSLLYGRRPPAEVANVDRQVRVQLRRGHALITPAERRAHPRIVRLVMAAAGPPVSLLATAIVRDGTESVLLQATLELRHRRWLVVALGG